MGSGPTTSVVTKTGRGPNEVPRGWYLLFLVLICFDLFLIIDYETDANGRQWNRGLSPRLIHVYDLPASRWMTAQIHPLCPLVRTGGPSVRK